MPSFDQKGVVLDNGIELPEFLFFFDSKKSKNISPAATFNPASALEGKAFENISSPSNKAIKKSLIITKSFFFPFKLENSVPIITKLKSLGFEIFLCCNEGEEKKLQKIEDLQGSEKSKEFLVNNLKKLTNFDEKNDFSLAKKLNISRDKTAVINYQKKSQIVDFLTKSNGCENGLLGNHLGMVYESCLKEEEWQFIDEKTKIQRIGLTADDWDFINKYDNAEELQKILRSLPKEQAAKIIDPQKNDISNISQLGIFLQFATPTLAEEALDEKISLIQEQGDLLQILSLLKNSPDVAEKIYKKKSGLLDCNDESYEYDLARLARDLKFIGNFSLLAKQLIDKEKNSIKSKIILYKYLDLVKTLPDLARELLDKKKDLITEQFYLAEYLDTLENFPDLAKKLLNEKKDLITDLSYLVECLKALKNFPDLVEKLLDEKKDLITNQYYLEKLLKALENFPDLAEKLLNEKKDLITDPNYLPECLKALKNFPDLAEKLLNEKKDLITDKYYLVECLKALKSSPDIAKKLFEEKSSLLNNHEKSVLLENKNYISDDLINEYSSELKCEADDISKIKKKFIEKTEDNLIEKTRPHYVYIEDDFDDFLNKFSSIDDSKNFLSETSVVEIGIAAKLEENKVNEIAEWLKSLPNLCLLVISDEAIAEKIANQLPNLEIEVKNNKTVNRSNFTSRLSNFDDSKKIQLIKDSSTNTNKNLIKNSQDNKKYSSTNTNKNPIETVSYNQHSGDAINIANQLPNLEIKVKNNKTVNQSNFTSHLSNFDDSKKIQLIKDSSTNTNKNLIKNSQDNKTVSYDSHCGAAINCDNPPHIRTEQVTYANIEKNFDGKCNFDESFLNAAKTIEVKKEEISSTKLRELKSQQGDHNYYLMEAKIPNNEGYYRLLSVIDGEEIESIEVENGANIEIKKGEDGFFYVKNLSKVNKPLNISYILKVKKELLNINDICNIDDEELEPNSSDANSVEDSDILKILKKVVSDYRDEGEGKSQFPKSLPNISQLNELEDCYKEREHDQWLKKIFAEKAGECRHNVVAIYGTAYQAVLEEYKKKNSQIDEKEIIAKAKRDFQRNIRATNVDDNHILLEVRKDNKWIKLEPTGKYRESGRDMVAEAEEIKIALNGSNDIAGSVANNIASSVANIDSDKMLRVLNEIETPQEFFEEDSIKQKIAEFGQNGNGLIISDDIDGHANFLLNQANQNRRKVFYISGPDKIDLNRTNLIIEGDKPILTENGLLSSFLADAKGDDHPLLIINWQAFSNKEKLALNTIIDSTRTIGGVKIDNSIQVIGLSKKLSQDSSFTSRHNWSLKSAVKFNKSKKREISDSIDIDLQGFPNWRRELFGKIIQQNDEMVWQKSHFVEEIERASNKGLSVNFHLTNLSKEAIQEFEREFEEAKARGKFIYQGHEISLPEEINITFSKKTFDFTKFNDSSKISVSNDVTFDRLPQGFTLVNSNIFDLVLSNKEINDGKYAEKVGLIGECAQKSEEERVLKLFISSNLSESQWYCLFNEAQKNSVKLEIANAPNVKIPNLVVAQQTSIEGLKDNSNSLISKIYISNNADKKTEELVNENNNLIVVNVEDFSYQDLIEKITFDKTESGFKNFQKIESEFLTRLKSGQKIILKGQFSSEFLQMIEPILTCQDPEFTEAGKNLILVIEDKECSKDAAYEPLQWLNKNCYEVTKYSIEEGKNTQFKREEVAKDEGDQLDDSKEKSEKFIQDRKKLLLDSLEHYPMTRLIGHSGVGKSGLLRHLEEDNAQETKIYRELNNFEKWATSESDKTKILFIDESNIEDLHFTMFSPLKSGTQESGAQEKVKLLYGGKFYDLDPKKHKVVFAQNPNDYGGGRNEQKLFEDGLIPAIYLEDFPASYIYEKILKEAIYEKLSDQVKDKIKEDDFKKICRPLISKYQEANSKQKSNDQEANEETARELQEKVLLHIYEKINTTTNIELSSKNFISTEATQEVEKALIDSLKIRKFQKLGDFPSKAVGLNGVLLEGGSGVGKSELIAAVFDSLKITERSVDDIEEISESKNHYFYKIDASLPIEQKQKIITKAFEEGNIVWIDEINSCIDDGLEKILNSALTGQHPEGKAIEAKSGFMLVSSVNSAYLEGRSTISPALRHRTIQPQVKKLQDYSEEDLAKIVNHWLAQEEEYSVSFVSENNRENVANNIAKNFTKLLKTEEGKDLNLRTLRSRLDKLVELYCEKKIDDEMRSCDDISSITSENNLQNQDLEKINEVGEGELITIETTPGNSPIAVDVIKFDPSLTKSAEENIWATKANESEKFISDNRKNYYRILPGVYGDNELDSEFMNSLFKKIIDNCAKKFDPKLNNSEIIKIISDAKKQGGIYNKFNIEKNKFEKSIENDGNEPCPNAKKFSGFFQKECGEMGIFTGRSSKNVRLVGLRLTFVPDEVLESLQNSNSNESNSELVNDELITKVKTNLKNQTFSLRKGSKFIVENRDSGRAG